MPTKVYESPHDIITVESNSSGDEVYQDPRETDIVELSSSGEKALAEGKKERACMERCIGLLQAAVAQLGPEWKVHPFGSAANGFGMLGSDLDLTIFRANDHEACDRASAVGVLQGQLEPLLENSSGLVVLQQIYGAKVPILKLRFEGYLDVDLSCHNLAALRNTRLLRAYGNFGGTLRSFGKAVKLWAKAAGICGAVARNLSSYTFTLMAIYFMQADPLVKLPCLPTAAFEHGGLGKKDPDVKAAYDVYARRRSSTPLDVKSLVCRFLRFFAEEFDWGKEVVSVRLGQRRQANQQDFMRLPHRWVARIHVEDPYELGRNLHCVLGADREEFLQVAFREAWQAVQAGSPPEGLEAIWESGKHRGAEHQWPLAHAQPGAGCHATAAAPGGAGHEQLATLKWLDEGKRSAGPLKEKRVPGAPREPCLPSPPEEDLVPVTALHQRWGQCPAGRQAAGGLLPPESSEEEVELAVKSTGGSWTRSTASSDGDGVDISSGPSCQSDGGGAEAIGSGGLGCQSDGGTTESTGIQGPDSRSSSFAEPPPPPPLRAAEPQEEPPPGAAIGEKVAATWLEASSSPELAAAAAGPGEKKCRTSGARKKRTAKDDVETPAELPGGSTSGQCQWGTGGGASGAGEGNWWQCMDSLHVQDEVNKVLKLSEAEQEAAAAAPTPPPAPTPLPAAAAPPKGARFCKASLAIREKLEKLPAVLGSSERPSPMAPGSSGQPAPLAALQ